jgi:DNA primase
VIVVATDYAAIADANLEVVIRSGDEWMCKCPYHEDRSPSLQFNVAKGLWICFSCQRKGNAKTLFGDKFREPEPDIEAVLAQLDLIESVQNEAPRKVLSESVLKRYSFPTDYWTERGFSSTIIKAFQLGYDPLENDATIPVRYMDGGLIGVIRRKLENDFGPKYMYPKGFPRKTTMFGSWMVAKTSTDHVVVTEGSVDAMAVWAAGIPAVGQYGSSISREQVMLLRRLGIQRVTLFYDNDEAGFHANHIALGLPSVECPKCQTHIENPRNKMYPLLEGFLVSVVRYKMNDLKDPGAMGRRIIRNRVDDAVLVL